MGKHHRVFTQRGTEICQPSPSFSGLLGRTKNFSLVGRMCESGRRKMEPGFAYKQADDINLTSVHSLSCVRLFATPWTAARQVSLSIPNSWRLLKLMSMESLMPSNHLILYCPLFLPPSIFHQGLFQWFSSSHWVAKVLELQLQHQSFQWIFWTDFL